MKARPTLARYAISLVLPLAKSAVEQMPSSPASLPHYLQWLTTISWWWVVVPCIAFIAGQFLADINNPKSSVAQWSKRRLQLFEKERLTIDPLSYPNTTQIRLDMRFMRRIRRATILFHIVGNAPATLVEREHVHIASGQRLSIVIADFPNGAGNGRWLPSSDAPRNISNHFRYLVTLEVQPASFWPAQQFKLYVDVNTARTQSDRVLFVTDEEVDLFDVSKISNWSGGYATW